MEEAFLLKSCEYFGNDGIKERIITQNEVSNIMIKRMPTHLN